MDLSIFNIGLTHFIVLATILFSIGLLGIMTSRNVIRVLMCLELMMNAVNINFVAFNNYLNPEILSGHVFAIFILTVSAAEAAVGLAIIIALYRQKRTVDVDEFNLLKL
ncbi:MAG: NADH-quinone oxidoreductase subunit NuoK [Vampirovibrio sp.]|nr:NADH-quinone oxidoreductase subunit NuoK [Vampirovibrio sp.]